MYETYLKGKKHCPQTFLRHYHLLHQTLVLLLLPPWTSPAHTTNNDTKKTTQARYVVSSLCSRLVNHQTDLNQLTIIAYLVSK